MERLEAELKAISENRGLTCEEARFRTQAALKSAMGRGIASLSTDAKKHIDRIKEVMQNTESAEEEADLFGK